MRYEAQFCLFQAVDIATRKSTDPTYRKRFLSDHADDVAEVEISIEDFGHVFIPRVIGVSEGDDFIDSMNIDYIMNKIREKYLTDLTVTIVLVGKCTWARKFVDWEVYSSLRNDNNKRNGLMAIALPSVSNDPDRKLPARVNDNVSGQDLYARWWKYPTSETLRSHIETAFADRTAKAHLIDNTRARRINNGVCE